jgi:nitrite reductase (NADH) large subunit
MKTNAPDVFAAGDVTSSSDTAIWPKAVEQGAIAGLNMIGMNKSIQPAVRCNMIDIAGLSVFSAGLFPDGAEVLKEKNRKLWVQNDTICGIVEIGQSGKSGVFLNMMNKKVSISPVRDKLLQTSFGYASLVEKTYQRANGT